MSDTDRPQANPVAVLREEADDWAILFNPDTNDAFGINPVGVAIWKAIDGRRDAAGIADAAREQFDDVPDTYRDDVLDFIRKLERMGFVGYEA